MLGFRGKIEDENEKETWKVHFHTQDTPILDDFKSVIDFLQGLIIFQILTCL